MVLSYPVITRKYFKLKSFKHNFVEGLVEICFLFWNDGLWKFFGEINCIDGVFDFKVLVVEKDRKNE